MIVFFIVFSVLMLLIILDRKHKKYVVLKFRYGLYSLRDELRMAAIKGDIDKSSWVFDHYDKTFSILIKDAKYLSVLYLILLDLAHSDDTKIIDFINKLEEEVSKNDALKIIHEKYILLLKTLLKDRMFITVNYFLLPIISPAVNLKLLFNKRNSWINKLLVFPETSESPRSFSGAVV